MADIDGIPGWPPAAEDLWLVHGTMGAPIGAANLEGVDRAVLMRLAARRNQSDEESDQTYYMDLDRTVATIAGLLSIANAAFGRENVQLAMAKHLGIVDD